MNKFVNKKCILICIFLLIGLFVNVGIIFLFEFDRYGKMKIFMGEIIILYKSYVMKIILLEIIYDGVYLFW